MVQGVDRRRVGRGYRGVDAAPAACRLRTRGKGSRRVARVAPSTFREPSDMDPKEITTFLGLGAIYLLSVNVLLGLLMSARYNPWKRWPHRRINLLKLHNWTAYVALGLAVLHPIPLLFIDKPRFTVSNIVWPVSSPQQPVVNTIGAISLYLLAFTVITSIYRAEIGRERWK